MSLHPSSPAEVPGQTAAVARAAFPGGNTCLRLRDELGTVFTDAQFTALFSFRGRPAEAPRRRALVTLFHLDVQIEDGADLQGPAVELLVSRCLLFQRDVDDQV